MRIIISLLLLLNILLIQAQDSNIDWIKSLDSYDLTAYGYDIKTDPEGNLYVLISFEGSLFIDELVTTDNHTILLFKVDSNSNILWKNQFSSYPNPLGYCFTVDQEGNTYITTNYSGDIYIEGDTIGKPEPVVITETDTFYYTSWCDFFIVKYDTDGNMEWNETINTLGDDHPYAISANSNNEIFVSAYTGDTYLNDGDTIYKEDETYSLKLLKFNGSGDILDTYKYTTGSWLSLQLCPIIHDSHNSVYHTYELGNADTLVFNGDTITSIFNKNLIILKFTENLQPIDYFLIQGASQTRFYNYESGEIRITGETGDSIIYQGNVIYGADGERYTIQIDTLGNLVSMGQMDIEFYCSEFYIDEYLYVFGYEYMGSETRRDIFMEKRGLNGDIQYQIRNFDASDQKGYDIIKRENSIYLMGSYEEKLKIGNDSIVCDTCDYALFIVRLQDYGIHVPELNISQNFHVYPNPNNGSFYVEGEKINLIEIYDISGILIKQIIPSEQTTLVELEDSKPGAYMIRASGDNGTLIRKVVVAN